MKVKELDVQHSTALTEKRNKADTLSMLAHHSEELKIFKSVYNMKVKELGEQHATILTTKPNIACTLYMSGKDSKALQIIK